MTNSPGRVRRVGLAAGMLFAGWLLAGLGAWQYARMRAIPEQTAIPVAAAFLIEIPFYILPSLTELRNRMASRGRAHTAGMMTVSAIAPWAAYSLATGEARLAPFLVLACIALGVAFWYVVLPITPVVDALFLVVLAAIYLSRAFDWIYISPIPKLSISVLGKLMLIRTAAMAILVLRGKVNVEFRFLPRRTEWKTGFFWFVPALPVVGLIYWALGLVRLRPHPLNALQAVGTLVGVLWAVALPEEFFFRGLLQQWLERWTASMKTALAAAAAIFGCAHLGFHRVFPNWRWAIVAGVLGIFLGLAWRNTRSIQTSMVTHALIVTVWRTFLL